MVYSSDQGDNDQLGGHRSNRSFDRHRLRISRRSNRRSGLAQDRHSKTTRSRSNSPRRRYGVHHSRRGEGSVRSIRDMNDRTLGRLYRRYYTSSDGSVTPPGKKITIRELSSAHSGDVPKVQPLLDGPEQWPTWSWGIKRYFKSHGVDGYVNGTIIPPDPRLDRESAKNWSMNDAYACLIIVSNISPSQLIHTNPCNTSREMWEALRFLHEPCGHQIAINYLTILLKSSISEDGDIPQHLNMVKDIWEKVNVFSGVHFKLSDQGFKLIIASSLPPSWDAFTDQYMGSETDIYRYDSKRNMLFHEFLGVIASEYQRRLIRPEISRANRISNDITASSPSASPCKLCRKMGHKTHDCPRWDDDVCMFCLMPGHTEDGCWTKHKDKRPARGARGTRNNRRSRNEQTHERAGPNEETEYVCAAIENTTDSAGCADADTIAPHDIAETVGFADADTIAPQATDAPAEYMDADISGPQDTTGDAADPSMDENRASNAATVLYPVTFGSHFITGELYDEEDDVDLKDDVVGYGNNDSIANYDWIADSATTSHICNTRSAFTEYTPAQKKVSVCGVGGNITLAEGRGTVKLQTHYQGKTHNMKLKDVLYVPSNRNNLLSLGRWARAGHQFTGGGTEIRLFAKDGICVASGFLSSPTNLYKVECQVPHNHTVK
jgi:hypothetical protein